MNNLIQRITATLTHRISHAVSLVENHDAVAEAMLQQGQASAAKARTRLARLIKEGEAMRVKLQDLQKAEAVWTQRAIVSAKEDESKALECIQRRNASREQFQQLTQALARHEEVEREVGASVARIDQKLQELNQQRNLMRSRHSAADALRVMNRIEGHSTYGIDDIFDRWEMLVTEMEYGNGGAVSDPLNAAFVKQENETELKAQLAALLAGNGDETQA